MNIKKLHEEFLEEYPNPNDRASTDSWGSVYVHWLERELIKERNINEVNQDLLSNREMG